MIQSHFLTKFTEVAYDPAAKCPRFLALLEEALGAEMVPYMKKVFGSCLSEDVSEKAFFILHGKTDAGKTKILNAIREILGPYAGLLQADTLTARGSNSNALADRAQLAGMRFAQTAELGDDAKLASRILKYLAQGTGSEIKGTLKYGNPQKIKETWHFFRLVRGICG